MTDMLDDEIIAKIQSLGDPGTPISILRWPNGKLEVSYEKSWKSGGTKAVEDEKGNITYEENYTEKSLTKSQINAIDEFIKSII